MRKQPPVEASVNQNGPFLQKFHRPQHASPLEFRQTLRLSHTANHNLFNLDDGLRVQLRNLLQEREVLREEIRQLRASVQIYAEVLRRLDRPAA